MTLPFTNDDLLTPAEVARVLRQSRRTIWAGCRSGKIPHVRLSSRSIRVRRSDLDGFLRKQTR